MIAQRVTASSEAARRRMVAARGRDTSPEKALRSRLHAMGFRFRVDHPLPGLRRRADISFVRARLVVFVDGCFWHGCPQHATWPKANAEFWRAKIETNRRRDADTNARLEAAGWRVLRFWEHEDAATVAETIAATVRALSPTART
jgi:DNA mismatch endonuclease (patch repair protein)